MASNTRSHAINNKLCITAETGQNTATTDNKVVFNPDMSSASPQPCFRMQRAIQRYTVSLPRVESQLWPGAARVFSCGVIGLFWRRSGKSSAVQSMALLRHFVVSIPCHLLFSCANSLPCPHPAITASPPPGVHVRHAFCMSLYNCSKREGDRRIERPEAG